jgi:hypothetical protein
LSTNKYIRFVDIASRLNKTSGIDLYSNKFSKKKYNQHQLLFLPLLEEYTEEDYRDIVELVDLMKEVKVKIELDEFPYFTTLQKFSHRINSCIFNRLLNRLINCSMIGENISPAPLIDSIGFTSSYMSHHYSWKTGKPRKRFIKISISVDIDNQIVTGFKIS